MRHLVLGAMLAVAAFVGTARADGPAADLAVSIQRTETTATISVANGGPDDASLVGLSGTVIGNLGWSLGGVDASACTPSTDAVSCSFDTIPAGSTREIMLTFGPTCGQSDVSFSSTSAADGNPGNDGASATVALECEVCIPNVTAGDDQEVDEGDPVTLTGAVLGGTCSVEPPTWTQTGGPFVTPDINGDTASFIAPSVDADTVLTFEYAAGGGTDTVQVTVRDVPTFDLVGLFGSLAKMKAKAGQSITIKVAVVDAQGLRVSDTTAASFLVPTCHLTFTPTTGGSSTCMKYDANKDQFVVVWKLPSTAPTIATFTVTLGEVGSPSAKTLTGQVSVVR